MRYLGIICLCVHGREDLEIRCANFMKGKRERERERESTHKLRLVVQKAGGGVGGEYMRSTKARASWRSQSAKESDSRIWNQILKRSVHTSRVVLRADAAAGPCVEGAALFAPI